MSVDLSAQQEPTISVITTVPVAQNGGEMDALLLGRIGVSTEQEKHRKHTNISTTNTQREINTANTKTKYLQQNKTKANFN